MGSVLENSQQETGSAISRGYILIISSLLALLATLASFWSQYQWVYSTAPFITESFGETYTPPDFYTYFIPFIVVFVLISLIPVLAFLIRKTEKLWILTVLGIIMSLAGFVAGIWLHLAFALYILAYVVSGCLIIYTGDLIKKDKSTSSGM